MANNTTPKDKKILKTVSIRDTINPAPVHVFKTLYNTNFTQNDSQADIIWSDCQWEDNTPDKSIMNLLNQPENSNMMINYFPEASEIFRKDRLNENLHSMEATYTGHFDHIIPQSWSLPEEYKIFKAWTKSRDVENLRRSRSLICSPKVDAPASAMTSSTKNSLGLPGANGGSSVEINNTQGSETQDIESEEAISRRKSCILKRKLSSQEITDNFNKRPSLMVPQAQNSIENISLSNANLSNFEQYYIVKPNDAQRGCGIYITENPNRDLNKNSDCVVSEYIGNPMLVEGYKTDLRIHVLLASLNPLSIYIHHEGFLRMATVKYEKPNLKNSKELYMHLTNWSLNKLNENCPFEFSGKDFSPEESNDKLLRSLTHYKKHMHDLDPTGHLEAKTWDEIKRIVYKTIIASYTDLKTEYERVFGAGSLNSSSNGVNMAPKCFQLLGYDIMLDEDYKPWFIEIKEWVLSWAKTR